MSRGLILPSDMSRWPKICVSLYILILKHRSQSSNNFEVYSSQVFAALAPLLSGGTEVTRWQYAYEEYSQTRVGSVSLV